MKKLIYLLLAIPIAFVSCETEQNDAQGLDSVNGKASTTSFEWNWNKCEESGSVRNLIAGQNMVVGTVSVEEVGEDYVITYNISEEGYCLTEAHVDVATTPDDLNNGFAVTKSGNPKIGNFDYVNDGVECMQNFSVTVANTGPWLAIHGVVVCSSDSPETIFANLPETADFCTGVQGPDSYLNMSIGEGPLAGEYEAWCIDNDQFISIETCYEGAMIYSSTETLPDGAFEFPENFDKVNYLLNQDIVGSPCPSGGVYTYGDLQLAIWKLLDDLSTGSIEGLGEYSDDCVDDLLEMAEDGEGFVPECGQVAGVIVILEGIQPLIIPFPLECAPCDETIWADGCDFPGNNWAMYFEYSDN